MGKKKFIDKKKSATFQLVARDSSDPNYGDGSSGDRVFVRVDNSAYSVDRFFGEHANDGAEDGQFAYDHNSLFADAPEGYGDDDDEDGGDFVRPIRTLPQSSALPDHIRKEILELGFPDDGYNYLTHLREIKNTGGGSAYYHNSKAKLDQLPLDVKAYDASRLEISEVNNESNEKSVYSVASRTVAVKVQKAVDPEVAALLDDSDLSRFGSDDEDLEEDFVVKANVPDEVELELNEKLNLVEKYVPDRKGTDWCNASCSQNNLAGFVGSNEVRDQQPVIKGYLNDEQPRARRLLDEQFDMLELQEYGTDYENEYDGFIAEEDTQHESLAEKLDALKDNVKEDLELDDKYRVPSDLLRIKDIQGNTESVESAAEVIRRCMEYAEKYENEDQVEYEVIVEESSDESEVWDCETIISTYSNLENHPGKIEAPGARRKKKLSETVSGALSAPNQVISLKGKEKLPVDYLPQVRKPAAEKVKDVTPSGKEQQKRKQHGQESKEEKKERKAAVKEEKREARRVKKEVKGLYRCEAQRAQRVAASTGPSSIHLM